MQTGAAALLLLAGLFITAPGAHAQTCPITQQTADSLDFSQVTGACGSLLTEVSRDTCDPCICALVDVFIPALAADGFDLAEAGGFTAAEALLTSCITVLFAPLTRAQISIATLARLGSCGYTEDEYPGCVDPYLTQEVPAPPVRDGGSGSCSCSEEFDPVCDYNGNWFTNLCIAECEGAKLVEKCAPVFKKVEEKAEPFVLTENDGPLIWKPGCACSHKKEDAQPVCDVDGRQYASKCYAECQGVREVVDCESLVVDFLPSGEGPLVEALDGEEPATDKPDITKPPAETPPVSGSPPAPPAPAPPVPPTSEPEPTPVPRPTPPLKQAPAPSPSRTQKDPKEDVVVPPEVLSIFSQFGIDASTLPPELTLLAFKVISNEQVTDEELKRAREILADEEQMAEVRATITPAYAQQLGIFAQSATGNNKLLLQELSDAVSQPTSTSPPSPSSNGAFSQCVKSCKPGKMVCSQSTGIKFESGCHARCAGVSDISTCPEAGSPPPSNGGIGLNAGVLTPLFSGVLAVLILAMQL